MGFVYCATNKINGKKYVGFSSRPIGVRISVHKYDASSGEGYLFHKAIRKYGWENFEWKILLDDVDICDLGYFETFFVKKLGTKVPNGYNLTDGGEGVPGRIVSPELRKKISESNRGKKKSETHKRNMSEAAKKRIRTPEEKEAILKGLNRLDVRKKISESQIGKKKHTEESKRLLSLSQKGRKHSEETRRKISETKKKQHSLQFIPGGFLL